MKDLTKPTEEQLEFIQEEFGVGEQEIRNMSREAWMAIREACFDIECAETTREGCSDRGEIAADIADIRYKELFE